MSEEQQTAAIYARYDYNEVQRAICDGTLNQLNWFASGNPDNLGRIYVRMPNPKLDLVIQKSGLTGEGNFHAFPAVLWTQGNDKETRAKLGSVMDNLNSAIKELKDILDDAHTYYEHLKSEKQADPPAKATTFGEVNAIIQNHISQLSKNWSNVAFVFTNFTREIRRNAEELDSIIPQVSDPELLQSLRQSLLSLAEASESYVASLNDAKLHLDITGSVTQLNAAELIVQKSDDVVELVAEVREAKARHSESFLTATAEYATARNAMLIPGKQEWLLDKLYQTIEQAQENHTKPDEKLLGILDAVASIKIHSQEKTHQTAGVQR